MNMETKNITQNPGKNAEPSAAKRHQTKENAVVEVYGQNGKIYCRMNNLSTSGAFFEIVNSSYSPKNKDIVRITVNLKQMSKTYVMHGEVVWSKGLGLGVSFIKQKDLFKKIAK